MSAPSIYPVVLCGGAGTRLWPMSRKNMPKPFVRFDGEESPLQSTVRRLEDCGFAAPLLMTTEDYRFVVNEQLKEIGSLAHRIVVEPEPRNTAPAICVAAEFIYGEAENALMLVCPADHVIRDTMQFAQALAKGAERARAGEIVVLGVSPDRPETGYGYIETKKPVTAEQGAVPFLRFVEKPDEATAASMIESGRFLWNCGIFLMSAQTARNAFARHSQEIRGAARQAIRTSQPDLNFLRLGDGYLRAPDISFDYAIMEHERGSVVILESGWNDLGSWSSIWQESERDEDGVHTSENATALSCENSLLLSYEEGIHVVGIGLRNIAAVATRDAVLITDLDSSQDVRLAVSELKRREVPQAEKFKREYRPWGYYETLALGPRYQVKSIVVHPGGQLSLQSHVHRAEHWVVVEGTAEVTVGKKTMLLSENQSVYIPLAETHRLANPGKVELRLIEVQSGAYLLEDDIIRYEDIYDRA